MPDLLAADAFLSALDEGAGAFHFRVFDDDEARKDRGRARKFDGDFTRHAHALSTANADGCGVFVVVNDGGQDAASIGRVRAVFADLDGAPLEPVLACGLEPHLIVESSPGKWHAYWLVDGLPLDQFEGVQRAIAAEFHSDPSVIDLPRVMRLPGFFHRKGEPFRSHVIHESGALPYPAATILERWPADSVPAQHAPQPVLGQVVEINRHASLLKETRFLAHDVQQGHMTRDEALAIMRDRVAGGRYSRHVPDDEIVRALDGALHKMPAQAPAELRTRAPDPYWGFKFAPDLVLNLGPTRWLISKLLPEDCTAVLYGPSGSMKSFVTLDMGLAIAHGVPWQGHATKQRTVFYLAGEGEQGFAKRVAAWSEHHELAPPPTFAFRQMPRIQDASQMDELIEAIRAIQAERGQAGLIIIDTLFTALDGGDENSGKDMGQIIAAMKRLRVEFGAAVLTVHHTGKVGEAARGHSSLPSGMDVMFYAKPGPAAMTVEITNPKQKDGAEHPSILLQATVHQLPIVGEDGEPETSLVLSNPAGQVMEAYKARAKKTEEGEAKTRNTPMGGNQTEALAALADLTAAGQLVSEPVLRQATQARGVEKSAAWYAVRALIQSGAIVRSGEFLRLKDAEET
ncbi:MAG: AAA family ATPase [Pseudoxanthomonas sp.]|nr:AAA family ATPase [Pseudoxanthomonas sp.]